MKLAKLSDFKKAGIVPALLTIQHHGIVMFVLPVLPVLWPVFFVQNIGKIRGVNEQCSFAFLLPSGLIPTFGTLCFEQRLSFRGPPSI
jgi:hypothetical protein